MEPARVNVGPGAIGSGNEERRCNIQTFLGDLKVDAAVPLGAGCQDFWVVI